MRVLVTGAAGFIGMHVAQILLQRGGEVIGIDNLNDYYDLNLKRARLQQLQPHRNFKFIHEDIADRQMVEALSTAQNPQRVVNLAAHAGVRYSITNLHAERRRTRHLCISQRTQENGRFSTQDRFLSEGIACWVNWYKTYKQV